MSILKQIKKELEKAKQVCPECNGNGWVQNQEWREYWKKYAKKVQEYLPADDAYHRAFKEMENEQPDIPEEEKCGRCEGEGYILEQEVQELLDLVRRLIC